ncbi:hypothetical protein Poli38472_009020 [Pythium oligandrum]|uniref:Uncharacterized protein n=1 Tax=Pythium oligandrum TaxID=41045 RepID=A0A8K1CM52_PYTOL|nr:hypothetical protein Poli38472_009020 [Pythium oligandrum]|eukprot:TMW64853.1 hypothetical protein Poli38472_009020 [Pythium oligandrum]
MKRHIEHGGSMVDEADGEMRGYEEQREKIHATCATIDRFNERLSAIRTQLHERHKHGVKSLPVLPSTQWTRDQGESASRIEEVYSQVKLPVLASTAHLHRQPNQEYLSPRAVEERARQQEQYVSDHERVIRAEEQAAVAIQNTERLAEEARIAMVVYTQNEESWNFDERAKRYQQVMQANKVAEAAKMQADDECVYARTLRAQLVDPYESMRPSQPKRVTASLTLESLSVATDLADHVLVWILAAPLLTLPFTPRDRTTQLVLDPEKELSTHVVYYAAASTQSPMSLQSEDHPPLDGWQCCSSHGVDPAPTLTPINSSMETWLIVGAGAAFVNGRYVCSGVHNRNKKFKSSSGIELFRKCLPRSSSIVQGLGDIDDSEQAQLNPQTSISREASPTAKVHDELPRALRSLEMDVSDFKSMKRIEEKQAMVTWAQEHESWLVKDALTGVIRRETSLDKVRRMCQECNTLFQENLVEETQQTLDKIIDELNHLRFLTVKVLEMIETWRAHARKLGFALYHESKVISDTSSETNGSGEAPLLGWSASITVSTGRQLYMGSKAFVSKFKRFCRPEDAKGQKERKLVYLGYFPTKDEAEQAYDKFAAAEARRLNTTVSHLPRRRNVFRSCGKHFAVESERIGPDYCIECKIKQLSSTVSADEWNPPFHFVPGENYILKMANDLDFLDTILPLKMLLNSSASGSAHEPFPLLGNVFLLPKTPIQDPSLVTLCTLGGIRIPPLKRSTKTNNQMENDGNQEVVDEALDSDRVLNVQRLFLQELQIYHPELFKDMKNTDDSQQPEEYHQRLKGVEATPRIVQALYWDRCAALRIQQERLPLAYRIPGIWCRPDEGEWASLIVRGKHQQHFVFELNLVKAGRELQGKRRKVLSMIRKLLKTPLYFIPSREVILQAIFEGEQVKGDVVMLEVKSTQKYLEKLAVDTLDDEQDKAAITYTAISRRSLEWMYGAVKPSLLSLDSIVASLVLHRATDGSKARIEVKDHLVLRNLFSREQETSLVPSDVTNELRLEHLQLEIDDLEDPRRLIISCRELQSQQRYFVDCSLYELFNLTRREIEKYWPRPRISVQEWRDLAACAALKIRFDQRNGRMSLVFDESIEYSANTTTTVEATDEADVNPAVEELNATVKIDVDPPQPVSDQVVEVRNAVACCRARRFRKHQAAIRQLAAIHLRVERLKDYELRRLPQEWKQMTLEDWVSEEARGVLLLDEKVLKQLKRAFTSRTRVGLNGEAQEQAMHILRHLAKEMLGASHELTQEAMLDHLQAVSQAVWWRRKHHIPNPELDFFDVAEWWRRILSEKARQKTATKNVKR